MDTTKIALTEAEWLAVYDAVAQFVENAEDAESVGHSVPELEPARSVMLRMGAVLAQMADAP